MVRGFMLSKRRNQKNQHDHGIGVAGRGLAVGAGVLLLSVVVFPDFSAKYLLASTSGVVGSDTSVAGEEPYTEFVGDEYDGNRMARYAQMRNGFGLANYGAYVEFDSIFPVGGRVRLNGGVIELKMPLQLLKGTRMTGGGVIKGSAELRTPPTDGSSVFIFPENESYALNYLGQTFWYYRFVTPSWYPDSSKFSTATSRYFVVFYASGSYYRYLSLSTTVRDVRIPQQASWQDYSFAITASTTSTNLYMIKDDGSSLSSVATDQVPGSPAAIAVNPTGSRLAVASNNSGIHIYEIDNTTSPETMNHLASGGNAVTYKNTGLEYSADGKFVAATETGAVVIYDLSADTVNFVASATVASAVRASWSSDDRLAVLGNGQLAVYLFDSVSGTLTLESSTVISGVTLNHVLWDREEDLIYVSHSAESGTNNSLRVFRYDRATKTFTLEAQLPYQYGFFGVGIAGDGRLGLNAGYSTSYGRVRVYGASGGADGLEISIPSVRLEADALVTMPIRITGNVVFELQGNSLIIGSGGSLEILEGATLTLRGGRVCFETGVQPIYLDRDDSLLILENVIFSGKGEIDVPHGSIKLVGDVILRRSASLNFYSAGGMKMDNGAVLIVEEDARFRFAPDTAAGASRFIEFGNDAAIVLESSILDVSTSGYDSSGSAGKIIVRGSSEIRGTPPTSTVTADFSSSGFEVSVESGSDLVIPSGTGVKF